MALLDPARATLRLSRDELAALLLVAADPSSPSLRHLGMAAAAGALAEVGAVVAGRPAPSVAALAGVVARPQLRLVVEIERGGAVVGHGAWATPDGAVVGRSVGADDLELTLSDPVSLPFAVAALVGLGRRPACPATGPVVTTVADLDEIMAAVAGGEAPPAGPGAGTTRPPPRWWTWPSTAPTRWRAWSSWMDGRGAVVEAGLTVVDGGQLGLWRCVAGSGGEAGPSTVLTLTPATPAEVWQALLGLLPWSGKDPARP